MGLSTSRRSLLRYSIIFGTFGIFGCTSDPDPTTPQQQGTPHRATQVPETFKRCTDFGGNERDPNDLLAKDAVDYQFHPNDAQKCSNCQFFCQQTTDDFSGACSKVKGEIRTSDWCSLYEPADWLGETPTIAGSS